MIWIFVFNIICSVLSYWLYTGCKKEIKEKGDAAYFDFSITLGMAASIMVCVVVTISWILFFINIIFWGLGNGR